MSARSGWQEELPSLGSLWPAGSRVLSHRPGCVPALLVLPTRARPRVLVPTGMPAANVMLRRHNTRLRERLAQEALRLGIRTGLLQLLPVARLAPVAEQADSGTIEDVVHEHVPGAHRVGVMLGPPRANAKPVLRVFDRAGRTVAFGKVGHNVLSAGLVRAEAAVLHALEGRHLSHVEPPRVLHAGPWQGIDLLLTTPLVASRQRASSWKLPMAAMQEVAEVDGTAWAPVRNSTYVCSLQQRVSALPNGAATHSVRRELSDVLDRFGDVELGYGRWHGDWAPWNMGARAGRLQLWDWERSQGDVPLGFDAIHFAVQRELRHVGPVQEAALAVRRSATDALARWYADERQVDATLLLYLAEIRQRYIADAGPEPTPRLRSRLHVVDGFSTILSERSEHSHAHA